MNKAFYIVGIVFSVVFFFVSAYYIAAVDEARYLDFVSYSYGSYNSYSYGSSVASSLTEEGALIALLFFLVFAAVDILGLLKVKTKTAKAMSIIGLSITGLFLLWDLAMMSSPGSMSFDEVGVAFLLYCLIALAFSIVGLIQSVRYSAMVRGGTAPNNGQERDILDS